MENTLENKEKFFSQYWGQKVLKATSIQGVHTVGKTFNGKIYPDQYLELTPLSQISDEDACHIAMLLVNWQSSMSPLKPENIKVRCRVDGDHVWDELVMEFLGSFEYTVRYRGGDFMTWIYPNGRCEWNTHNHLKVYDFLRSRGSALPWMGLSVEEQIEYGWVKLKEVNK